MSSTAPEESGTDEIGFCTSGTEVASEIITEIEEVITPNLNDCVTVLWSVPWIDVGDLDWLVVPVWK